MAGKNEFLVCNPSFFNIDYEINAWMSIDNSADQMLAKKQWINMCDRLITSGASLKYIDPHPHFPDMVFTANAGLVRGKTVVLSNFKNEERRGEKKFFKKWFLDNGYRVVELPDNIYFEGAGDAIFFRNVLYLGYGFRTSKESHKLVASVFNTEYVSCKLIDPHFYHLDTCFFPIEGRNLAIYYNKAFSKQSIKEINKNLVGSTIGALGSLDIAPISKNQAKEFICNSVDINHKIVTPSTDWMDLSGSIKNIKWCDMSEFMKAGGAVRCLTLKL